MTKLRRPTSHTSTSSPNNPHSRALRCERLEDRRLLAVVTVDTVEDVVDFNDGVTSLREAIFATNTVAGADEINFDFGFDGPATILLTQGELQITDSLTINGPGRDLLTIDASGNDPTPDSTHEDGDNTNDGDGSLLLRIDDGILHETIQVFAKSLRLTGADDAQGAAVYSNEQLKISDVVISKNFGSGVLSYGELEVENSHLSENSYVGVESEGNATIISSTVAHNLSGGIAAAGTLFVTGSDISNNSGSGITTQYSSTTTIRDTNLSSNSSQYRGGGLLLRGDAIVHGTTISNNSAGSEGGGLHFTAGRIEIRESIVKDNSTLNGNGGGIHNWGDMSIVQSSISGNETSHFGAGVKNGGVLRILRSHISNNTSHVIGGGLYLAGETTLVDSTVSGNTARAIGGGVHFSGSLKISGGTISDNSAGGHAGGISSSSRRNNEAIITNSTITGNLADASGNGFGTGGGIFVREGSVNIDHTIVAGNIGNNGAADDIAGTITSNFSLIGEGAEFLAPLADNGGPTLTHALLPGSPAINAGDLNAVAGEDGVPEFDQRGEGFDRIVSRLDIGAYEVQELGDMNLLVDTLVDESDGDFSRGDLSLREAIELSNANPVPDTIEFDPSLNGGTILLTQGELQITDSLTINGPGAELLTIDASGNDRTPDIDDFLGSIIFEISDDNEHISQEVGINGLRITGGDSFLAGAIRSVENLTLKEVDVDQNNGFRAGAIYLANGSFQIISSSITANRGIDGGGIYFAGGSLEVVSSTIDSNIANGRGGGIFVDRGTLQVELSSISTNQSSSWGGGIAISSSDPASISDSVVSNNETGGEGGGLHISGGADQFTEVLRTTISGNKASVLNPHSFGGGGIFLSSSELNIENSLIRDNHSRTGGGGIISRYAGLLILNSTITGNSAFGNGGGVYGKGNFNVKNSTITFNVADANDNLRGLGAGIYGSGTSTIDHSIVSGNKTGPGSVDDDMYARFAGNEIFSSLIGTLGPLGFLTPRWVADDATKIGIDPLLAPLADNGGPTLTHALLLGSPAINAGGLNAIAGEDGVPEFDQRGEGFDRIVSRIDIGAYEVQELGDMNLLVDTLVDESDGDFSRGDLSLREAIELSNANPVLDTIEFIAFPATTASPATIFLTEGELAIHDDLAIRVSSPSGLRVDASENDEMPGQGNGDGSRVFNIDDHDPDHESEVSISGLTISGGDVTGVGGGILSREKLTLENVEIRDNFATDAGGGLALFHDTEIGDRTSIENNSANRGGGIYTAGRSLIIVDSDVSGNRSTEAGAGILAESGAELQLIESVVQNSRIFDELIEGGGIHISNSQLIMQGGRISNNFANQGGGIWSESSTLTLRGVRLDSNGTTNSGGAIAALDSAIEITDSELFNNGLRRSQRGGGLDLRGGTATIRGTVFGGNRATFGEGGGAIAVAGNQSPATLHITDTQFLSNSAGSGGALAIWGDVDATINAGTFFGNQALQIGGNGGAIAAYTGSQLNVHASDFQNNRADVWGGAIYTLGEFSMARSLVRNSFVRSGGAIYVSLEATDSARIESSAIIENSAGMGGGIYVANRGGEFELLNSIVASNAAEIDGGGLFFAAPFDVLQANDETSAVEASPDEPVNQIRHSTIAYNRVSPGFLGLVGHGVATFIASVNITHTILYANGNQSEEADLATLDGQGQFVADYSMIGSVAPGTPLILTETTIGVDPLIGPLTHFQGPAAPPEDFLPFIPLLDESPAIDAGFPALQQSNVVLPEFDQRGAPFARVVGGRIDLGGFEVQSSAAGLSGDFDEDGDVDGSDFLSWQRGFGIEFGAQRSDGDATDNGAVDANDLAVWEATFDRQSPLAEDGGVAAIDLALAAEFVVDDSPQKSVRGPVASRNAYAEFVVDRVPEFSATSESRRDRHELPAVPSEREIGLDANDSVEFDAALDEIFAEI